MHTEWGSSHCALKWGETITHVPSAFPSPSKTKDMNSSPPHLKFVLTASSARIQNVFCDRFPKDKGCKFLKKKKWISHVKKLRGIDE